MAKGLYHKWLEPDNLTLLRKWARNGLTDQQIAENIGISTVTLYDWKKKYPNFSNALKKGKDVIDTEVENALLKAAMGYEYTEQEAYVDDLGKKRVKQVKKYAKPDTTALIFWLKNRQPSDWRDRKDVDLSAKVDKTDISKYKKYITEEMKNDKS